MSSEAHHDVSGLPTILRGGAEDLANAVRERDQWNLKIVQAQHAVRALSAMGAECRDMLGEKNNGGVREKFF